MRISYENYIDDYTLTATTENTNYPATNLQDSRLSKVWRSTAITTQTLTIDSGVGNTLSPTFAALFNTTLTAAATIKIQGSADNFATTPVDTTMTRVDAWTICAIVTPGSGYRYWRFSVADTTGTYISIGRAWLGTYISLTTAFSNSFSEQLMDTSVQKQSISGQQYGDEGVLIRKYALVFPYLTNTERGTITTFVNAVKKAYKFVFLFQDSTFTNIAPLYCCLDSDTSLPHIHNNKWQFQCSITEAK